MQKFIKSIWNSLSEIVEEHFVLLVLFMVVAPFFIFIGFICYDSAKGTDEIKTATVVDKHYKSSEYHSTTTLGSDGKIYTSSTNSPEAFQIMVRTEDGVVRMTESNASIYYSKKINDRCEIKIHRGKLSGSILSIKTVK